MSPWVTTWVINNYLIKTKYGILEKYARIWFLLWSNHKNCLANTFTTKVWKTDWKSFHQKHLSGSLLVAHDATNLLWWLVQHLDPCWVYEMDLSFRLSAGRLILTGLFTSLLNYGLLQVINLCVWFKPGTQHTYKHSYCQHFKIPGLSSLLRASQGHRAVERPVTLCYWCFLRCQHQYSNISSAATGAGKKAE